MGDWPLFPAAGGVQNGSMRSVQTGASANTKTAWVESIASVNKEGHLAIDFHPADAPQDYLLDIGVGAAGSEVVLVGNIYGCCIAASEYGQVHSIVFPVRVPAGARISSRVQSSGASKWSDHVIHIIQGSTFSPSVLGRKVVTYGAATGDSGGMSVDPGATVNVKGAYSELNASCSHLKGFLLAFGTQIITTRNDFEAWSVDIAVGSAGSEVVIVPDIRLWARAFVYDILPRWSVFFPVPVSASSRIAVRASCSHNTYRTIDVILYGIV